MFNELTNCQNNESMPAAHKPKKEVKQFCRYASAQAPIERIAAAQQIKTAIIDKINEFDAEMLEDFLQFMNKFQAKASKSLNEFDPKLEVALRLLDKALDKNSRNSPDFVIWNLHDLYKRLGQTSVKWQP